MAFNLHWWKKILHTETLQQSTFLEIYWYDGNSGGSVMLKGCHPSGGPRLCSTAEMHFFAIARRIMFIFMNYGCQWVEDIYLFCTAFVLLPHTQSGLLPYVTLAVFLQSIFIPRTVDKEFSLMHGRHNLHFKVHVHGRIKLCGRPHAPVRPQVVHPYSELRHGTWSTGEQKKRYKDYIL